MKHKNPVAPLHFFEVWYTGLVRGQKTNYKYRREGWTSQKTITTNSCPGYDSRNKRPTEFFARIAQLVEQMICNHQVVGSNPIPSSRQIKEI